MRTIVNMRDVLSEYHKTLECPRCNTELPLVQATLSLRKGAMFIQRGGFCGTHGYVSEDRMLRTILRNGSDAQINDPQALAYLNGEGGDT